MEALFEVIRKTIVEAAELDDVAIDPDVDLTTFDVDSLAGLEVAVNLEKHYRIRIPAAKYPDMTTIRAIATIVQELLDQPANLQQQPAGADA